MHNGCKADLWIWDDVLCLCDVKTGSPACMVGMGTGGRDGEANHAVAPVGADKHAEDDWVKWTGTVWTSQGGMQECCGNQTDVRVDKQQVGSDRSVAWSNG